MPPRAAPARAAAAAADAPPTPTATVVAEAVPAPVLHPPQLQPLANLLTPSDETSTQGGEAQGAIFSMATTQGLIFLGLHTGIIEVHPIVRNQEGKKEIAAHKGIVRQLLVHPTNPTMLFSCSVDHSVKSWSVPSCAWTMTFTGHTSPVQCMAIDPAKKGLQLYSGCEEGFLNVWDIASGSLVQSMRCHVGSLTGLVVPQVPPPPVLAPGEEPPVSTEPEEEPPKAGTVLTGSNDTIGKLLEPATKLVHAVFRAEHPISAVAYAHPHVLLGCSDGIIRGFHIHTANPKLLLRWGHSDGINCMLPLPQDRLLTASDDQQVLCWNLKRWSKDFAFPVTHASCVTSLVMLEPAGGQPAAVAAASPAAEAAAAPSASNNNSTSQPRLLTAGFDGGVVQWGLSDLFEYLRLLDIACAPPPGEKKKKKQPDVAPKKKK